jgi:hypothetical protein
MLILLSNTYRISVERMAGLVLVMKPSRIKQSCRTDKCARQLFVRTMWVWEQEFKTTHHRCLLSARCFADRKDTNKKEPKHFLLLYLGLYRCLLQALEHFWRSGLEGTHPTPALSDNRTVCIVQQLITRIVQMYINPLSQAPRLGQYLCTYYPHNTLIRVYGTRIPPSSRVDFGSVVTPCALDNSLVIRPRMSMRTYW